MDAFDCTQGKFPINIKHEIVRCVLLASMAARQKDRERLSSTRNWREIDMTARALEIQASYAYKRLRNTAHYNHIDFREIRRTVLIGLNGELAKETDGRAREAVRTGTKQFLKRIYKQQTLNA